MKTFILLLVGIFSLNVVIANDGAFYTSGNQLIPIMETDIAVTKEVLRLKRVAGNLLEVSVYYEFYNPKETKDVLVGFEAMSPSGDVNGAPGKDGEHPYMSGFKVKLNDRSLNYQVSLVSDSLYKNKGSIQALDWDTFKGKKEGNEVEFYYVYHFKAHFLKGKNIIEHNYKFDLSHGVAYQYLFEYVLTAAKRWANKQIDDFTLEIDMGEFQEYYLLKTFFDKASDWKIQGRGLAKAVSQKDDGIIDHDALKFYMQKGKIVFKKKNFKPSSELYLQSLSPFIEKSTMNKEGFYLPFSIQGAAYMPWIKSPNIFELKLLRNLPFARRGYLFKDPELKSFYKHVDWYQPNANYKPSLEGLTKEEREWLESLLEKGYPNWMD